VDIVVVLELYYRQKVIPIVLPFVYKNS